MHAELDYRIGLATIPDNGPEDFRNRSPRPPELAHAFANGSGKHHPELPAGKFQPERVVAWNNYMIGVIHGDDGNTYAWRGDDFSLHNVDRVYLLARQMHV